MLLFSINLFKSQPRTLLILLSLITFSACNQEPVEWVDVPLSENVYYDEVREVQSNIVEIPVPANSDLEYMLTMKQGNSVSYRWQASDLSDPELLLAEFHGHTIRESDAPGEVMFYKQGRGENSEGYLVAPFDGEHGWFLANETDQDINVSLTLTGFYQIQ
jgi:hypothetical protein